MKKNKRLLTDDLLGFVEQLSKKISLGKGWQNKGDLITVWENEKRNFVLRKNKDNSYDVFFGLEFNPTLVLKSIKTFGELRTLYSLLCREKMTLQKSKTFEIFESEENERRFSNSCFGNSLTQGCNGSYVYNN